MSARLSIYLSLFILLFNGSPTGAATSSEQAANSSHLWTTSPTEYTLLASGSAGPPDSVIQNGTIKGFVHESGSGAALNGIPVFAKLTDALVVELYDTVSGVLSSESQVQLTNTITHEALSNADGSYSLSGLATGRYVVWFEADNSPYIPQYFHQAPNAASGITIEVIGDNILSGVDFNLSKGGIIKGKATQQIDGSPVEGITVSALNVKNGKKAATASTLADGSYLLQGLPEGSFRIKAENTALYVDAYYGGTNTPVSAAPIEISPGQTTDNIDFSLVRHGVISGTVSSATGDKLESIRLKASLIVGGKPRPTNQALTDKDGNFQITKIIPGDYIVSAEANANFILTYFNNQTDPEQASHITVADGQTVMETNFTLEVGGRVTGRVTDQENGQPLSQVAMQAINSQTGQAISTTKTKNDGTYTIERLATGTYKISAQSLEHIPQYFDNVAELASATEISVTAGATREGVNLQLPALPVELAGTISGRLFWNMDDTPVSRGCVTAYDLGTKKRAGQNCSGVDGTYSIVGLAQGDYRLCARVSLSGLYIGECYNDVLFKFPEQATPISVADGAAVSSIDFGLAKIGSIAGRLIRLSDQIEIGTYEVRNLPGEYFVKIRTTGSGYKGKYYNDALSVDTAAPVSIIDGQTTLAIDFALETEGEQSVAGLIFQ